MSDVVHTVWGEPSRPPLDPDDWDSVMVVHTRHPCPTCGTALVVLLHDAERIEEFAAEVMAEYDVSFPDGWADGYDAPVYVYCDAEPCEYHAVAEWSDLAPALDHWMAGDAPTWSDRLADADGGQP